MLRISEATVLPEVHAQGAWGPLPALTMLSVLIGSHKFLGQGKNSADPRDRVAVFLSYSRVASRLQDKQPARLSGQIWES